MMSGANELCRLEFGLLVSWRKFSSEREISVTHCDGVVLVVVVVVVVVVLVGGSNTEVGK